MNSQNKDTNYYFHSLDVKDVFNILDSNEKGLSEAEASERLKQYGKNEIEDSESKNLLMIFIKQFRSILVLILVIAAVISYYTDHPGDAIIIFAVIIINAIVGFVQEYRAERSLQSLKKMIVQTSKVFRDGELKQINSSGLVPGDIILIEEGDKIPADARVIEAKNLRTVESILTGESLPVDKNVKKVAQQINISDMSNMLWLGTLCATGRATAIVTFTGQKTAIGQIASEIETIPSKNTHFKMITDKLAIQMGSFSILGAVIIFFVGFFLRAFEFKDIFLFSVASLVSAIPEGLPVILAIVLAIAANRMAKRKAIIRDLPATETLGIVDVIATDKTGTLTENTMTVREVVLNNGEKFKITGDGYRTDGDFYNDESLIIPLENPELNTLLKICLVSNGSKVSQDKIIGDPTEAALKVLAKKAGLKKDVVLSQEEIIEDFSFSTDLKLRATLIRKASKNYLYVVGAPEALNKYSKKKMSESLSKDLHGMATRAMRVIGIAMKEIDLDKIEELENHLNNLEIVGLVGMIDPPRPEIKEAIAKAKSAGIRVIMLTGDHKQTAVAISKDIGLIDEKTDKAYVQDELEKMNAEEFEKAIADADVFSRLTPTMKLKIAKKLQELGYTIAMTGDGVNDAPALKQADVGISMGIMGTDTAREASDIVLANDNFASIVYAIEEGRTAFDNVRRSSSYLITTSIAEQFTLILTMLIGYPLPLLPSQVLWINLVTDGVADFALATESSHGTILNRPPRKKKEGILNREVLAILILVSFIMVVLSIAIFNHYLPNVEKARTGVFAVMAFTQLFNMFNYRSFTRSIFKIGFTTNKFVFFGYIGSVILTLIAIEFEPLAKLLSFKSLGPDDLLVLFLLSSVVLWGGELFKVVKHLLNKTSSKDIDHFQTD